MSVPAGSESGQFRAGKLSLWGIPAGRVQEQDFPEDVFHLPCLWSVMRIGFGVVQGSHLLGSPLGKF